MSKHNYRTSNRPMAAHANQSGAVEIPQNTHAIGESDVERMMAAARKVYESLGLPIPAALRVKRTVRKSRAVVTRGASPAAARIAQRGALTRTERLMRETFERRV